jgi:hypothetical protein
MRILILVCLVGLALAVEDPIKISSEIRERHRAEMTAAALAWLNAADLAEIPAPKLSADPTRSEQERAIDVRSLNEFLGQLRQWRDRAAKGDKEGEQAAHQWFGTMKPNGQMALYMKYKGKAATASK